jgi:hypothetical protein
LPLPDTGNLTDRQRALLVWTEAAPDPSRPRDVLVEAQARWDNPDAAPTLLASAPPPQVTKKPIFRPSDDDEDDDDAKRRRQGRPGIPSERPLRVLVDLTGPLVESSDAVGDAKITSIETDFGSALNFEGAYFHHVDVTGGAIPAGRASRLASQGPPGGMRITFHFTPPMESMHQLTRLNGSLKLRISQNRTQTLIRNLPSRTGRKITTRELTKLDVALAAQVEEDEILLRLVEGDDSQISEVVAVDTYGDPVTGVTVTQEEGSGQAEGRMVHRLTFANGIPNEVGLAIVANSSVREVDVPFRFTDLPVPSAPGIPGL